MIVLARAIAPPLLCVGALSDELKLAAARGQQHLFVLFEPELREELADLLGISPMPHKSMSPWSRSQKSSDRQ